VRLGDQPVLRRPRLQPPRSAAGDGAPGTLFGVQTPQRGLDIGRDDLALVVAVEAERAEELVELVDVRRATRARAGR
jgi:hypothetical protein